MDNLISSFILAASSGSASAPPPPANDSLLPDETNYDVVIADLNSSDIAYSPTLNRYVAGGRNILVSSDARVWRSVRLVDQIPSISGIDSAQAIGVVRWVNGRFVAISASTATQGARVYSSLDGLTWSLTATLAVNASASGIAFGAGLYVITINQPANTCSALSSPDLVTWTSRLTYSHPTVSSTIRNVIFDSNIGRFVIGGVLSVSSQPRGYVTSSNNGIDWDAAATATSSAAEIVDVGVVNSRVLAINSLGQLCVGPEGGNLPNLDNVISAGMTTGTNRICTFGSNAILVGAGGRISFSNNSFTNTTTITFAQPINANLTRAVAGADKFVIIGAQFHAFLNFDGTGAESRQILKGSSLNVVKVIWSTAHAAYFAIGRNGLTGAGLISRSENGIDWQNVYTNGGTGFNDIVEGNGVLVAVRNRTGTGDACISYSLNGVNWQPCNITGALISTSTLSSITVNGLIFAEGVFVAVGGRLLICSSTDGINWATRSFASTDTREFFLSTLLHSGTTFSVVSNYTGTAGNTVPTSFISNDGLTWFAGAVPTGQISWARGASNNNGVLIMAGDTGAVNNRFVVSTNHGSSWSYVSASSPSGQILNSSFAGAVWTGTRFVVSNNLGIHTFESPYTGFTRRSTIIVNSVGILGNKIVALPSLSSSDDGLLWANGPRATVSQVSASISGNSPIPFVFGFNGSLCVPRL